VIAVGVGSRPGAAPAAVRAAVDAVLAEAGIHAADVAVLATADRRTGEPALRELAAARGWRLAGLPAAELAGQPVPHPSAAVAAAVGTPSVAEAAALRAAGPGSALAVPKRVFPGVTAAVAVGGSPGGPRAR
jgi:cobalt-precorrin 5A hydrolase